MTTGKKPSHIESSWRLSELTEEAVKIQVGSLFQNFLTRTEKNVAADYDLVEL